MPLTSPYKDLHIYYIEGIPDPGSVDFDRDFIGNWQEGGYSFLFFSTPADEKVNRLVAGQPHLSLIDVYSMPYEEWQGEKPGPAAIGGFLIIPPWCSSNDKADEGMKKIILDPGVVFGTGMHPTTRDCLEAVKRLCYKEKIETAIDIGTGTGLLAIAAVSMGCRHVVAVDLNFLAAKTATHNAFLNGMGKDISVIQGQAEDFIDKPADLVIANIHYDVMKNIVKKKYLQTKKYFILSGLLRSQAREIDVMLNDLSLTMLNRLEHDGIWYTFYGSTGCERT